MFSFFLSFETKVIINKCLMEVKEQRRKWELFFFFLYTDIVLSLKLKDKDSIIVALYGDVPRILNLLAAVFSENRSF